MHTVRSIRHFDLQGSDLLALAGERAARVPLLRGSHRGADANLVGAIGEACFMRLCAEHGLECLDDSAAQTQYDFRVGRWRVEVKTKDHTVPPRRGYACSVPAYVIDHQRPDFFYFVSLLRDRAAEGPQRFVRAFMLGGLDAESFVRIGRRWEAGQTDPANATKFWTAVVNVPADRLAPNYAVFRFLKGGPAMMRRPTRRIELYRWHTAALAGERPPVHEGEPQAGWYKMRRTKGGPWVPVKIWVEQEVDEIGELSAPETVRALAIAEPVDPARVWISAARNPISRQQYEALMRAHRDDPRMAATDIPYRSEGAPRP